MRAWLLLMIAFSIPALPLAGQNEFRKAHRYYKKCMERPPMLCKTRGRERLAETGDRRAAEILAASYKGLEAPKDRNRAIVVSLLDRHFPPAESVARFQKLMKGNQGRKHAWLWFKGLQLEADQNGIEAVMAAYKKQRDPFVKYAALQAMFDAEYKDLKAVRTLLAKPPTDPMERYLMMGAVMEGMHFYQGKLGTEDYDSTLELAINQFDDKKTSRSCKIMMSRYLGKIFNFESHSLSAKSWLRQLKAGRSKTSEDDQYGTSFFDIKAHGDRIAFVIDLSDSMLTPLPDKVRKRGGVTGVSSKKKDNDPFESEYQIPWHKIHNRLDLARENIKLSLYRLKKDKHFAVIGFGERAQLISGCSGMIPATRKNIKRVIRALDSLKPGMKRSDRPYGTLWGSTNLHGGLQRAFGVKKKGIVTESEFTDKKALLQGAETIFVLSDGNPTWADYDLVAPDYKEDQAGDPESSTPMARAADMHYPGPYRNWERLLEDAKRMNLFRKVEIHCIGIGTDVRERELKRLATLGLGKTKIFKL